MTKIIVFYFSCLLSRWELMFVLGTYDLNELQILLVSDEVRPADCQTLLKLLFRPETVPSYIPNVFGEEAEAVRKYFLESQFAPDISDNSILDNDIPRYHSGTMLAITEDRRQLSSVEIALIVVAVPLSLAICILLMTVLVQKACPKTKQYIKKNMHDITLV